MTPHLELHSTKFDRSLHYRYPVKLVQYAERNLITYCAAGTTAESHRGPRTLERHILSHFWIDKPYVLHAEWNEDWQPDYLYVDITSATSWGDGTVRYIDLDLDLIQRHGSTAVYLDDADEFEIHRVLWEYPDELVKQCWDAVAEVRGLLETSSHPFSDSTFDWRPTAGR